MNLSRNHNVICLFALRARKGHTYFCSKAVTIVEIGYRLWFGSAQ
jgi:hypothetical protein